MIDLSQFKVWTEEEFERVFSSPPVSSRPNGGGAGTQGAQGGASAAADDVDESVLPDELMKLIRDGVPSSRDRSRKFMKAAGWLEELGFGVESAYKLFARYPDGIAQKYTKPRDRLRREVERAYDKIKAKGASPHPLCPRPLCLRWFSPFLCRRLCPRR